MEIATDKNEERESPIRSLGRFLGWAAAILILYLASTGPVLMLDSRHTTRSFPNFLRMLYYPIGWMYESTPLRKPLGVYFHLWDPKDFDEDGNSHYLK
jgi:hypothetical protein